MSKRTYPDTVLLQHAVADFRHWANEQEWTNFGEPIPLPKLLWPLLRNAANDYLPAKDHILANQPPPDGAIMFLGVAFIFIDEAQFYFPKPQTHPQT